MKISICIIQSETSGTIAGLLNCHLHYVTAPYFSLSPKIRKNILGSCPCSTVCQNGQAVVIIDIPEGHWALISDTMYNKFSIAGSTTGDMRLCPHIYNTDATLIVRSPM